MIDNIYHPIESFPVKSSSSSYYITYLQVLYSRVDILTYLKNNSNKRGKIEVSAVVEFAQTKWNYSPSRDWQEKVYFFSY